MIYLQSRTILVTIRELKQENHFFDYLVGDTLYSNIPSQVIDNAFIGANWNRALKYGQDFLAEEILNSNSEVERLGYYKMSFDLYYDELTQQLKVLTKNSFDQQIVQQQHFATFLKQVILVNNKYKENYALKIPNQLWSTQLVNINQTHQLPVTNFTHFVINNDFDIDQVHGKYKYLIKSGLTTKIEITKYQQVIYFFNKEQLGLNTDSFSYLNLENNLIYLNGILELQDNDNLKLMISYEDSNYVNELKNAILDQFANFLGTSNFKLLHFFNMTGDLTYLEAELKSYQNLNYSKIIEQLNFKFDQIKSNHYPLIFQEEKLRTILFNSIESLDELQEFQHQANRFGILFENEILAIEKKFIELR